MNKQLQEFVTRNDAHVRDMSADDELRTLSRQWFQRANRHEYSYHFTWLGRPIIQYPQDVMAMQELIWRVQPDAIIETGVAHGGSLVFYASMLSLLGGDRIAIGVDIEIREHNRRALESHFLAPRMRLIEGSSVSPAVVASIRDVLDGRRRILVTLDSNHAHDHVLRELQLYSPLVPLGSYIVVFDTVIADLPEDDLGNRPWTTTRNPKTAVHEFLGTTDAFEVDHDITDRLVLTVAPEGYLRRVRD